MDHIVYGNGVAKSAVDIALHDVIAKTLGVPLYKIIGGAFSESIPIRFAVGIDTPGKMAAHSKKAIKAGFKGIKMKVGLNPAEDVERVAAIRESIGSSIPIDVDVNGAYRAKEAIETLKKMEKFSPLLIEQPVARDDLEGMAYVRKSVNVPIGACESAITLSQILRIIKYGSRRFFQLQDQPFGGFSGQAGGSYD
jgi:L-alanine-DL-glutamate epimerase-like enolase superfamily enzyme